MKVTVLDTSKKSLDVLGKLARWADTIEFAYAWVSTAQGQSDHWRCLDLAKVTRAVVGTQFAQTEPWALRTLDTQPGRLRLVISGEGTFHPKLLIARKGPAVRVIMGSSNLTSAGFSTNTEVNLLLEADDRDSEIRKLSQYIDDAWNSARPMDPAWLADYELAWRRRPRGAGLVPQAALTPQSFDSIDVDWDAYVALILGQEQRPISPTFKISLFAPTDSYLQEFRFGREAFAATPRFADMSLENRKRVIGMGDSSGLLGTMHAAGDAKKTVYKFPELVGVHLDRLPLVGRVSMGIVEGVLSGLSEIRGISIGVASRLLVAKRPDLFVSVNNGSRPALSRLRNGQNITTVRHYCELLNALWSTSWFKAPRPDDEMGALVWDHRAAILDAALYESVAAA